MVTTPVLYITFARPEYARQSFDAIKKAKPSKLYFYSNIARADRPDEIVRNNEVRSYINEIDWNCELKTYFREEYVDVFTSLWGAIDWVFDNEEEAIILEEDCVASLAFFDYCEKLLPKYRNEPKVWFISGNNFTTKGNPEGLSYFYTRYGHIYGWACWADRWKNMDRKMVGWSMMKKNKNLESYTVNRISALISRIQFDRVYKMNFTPWDSVFVYNCIHNKAYGIIPNVNLVANIGVVGENHSSIYNELKNVITSKKHEFNIVNEPTVILPTSYDAYHFKYHIIKPIIIRKIELLIRFFFIKKIET